jgi:hypothetical protein
VRGGERPFFFFFFFISPLSHKTKEQNNTATIEVGKNALKSKPLPISLVDTNKGGKKRMP